VIAGKQRAKTRQAVFYEGDDVIGGGLIYGSFLNK